MAIATSPPPPFHTLSVAEALQAEEVDQQSGLSTAEAEKRRGEVRPEQVRRGQEGALAGGKSRRQYADPMQIVLLVAGIGSMVPLKQWGTGILLILLTLLNAFLGLHQEGKAAAAISALQKMMIIKAKVRRDGKLVELPGELVPGDVVLMEAGDLGAGRRAPAAHGHPGDRRVGADRGEPAGQQESVEACGAVDTDPRRPVRHGLHEHQRHPGLRRDAGDRDRHGHRGRPHLRHAHEADAVRRKVTLHEGQGGRASCRMTLGFPGRSLGNDTEQQEGRCLA